MTPEESLRQGDVAGALAALKEQVRANPADSKLRTFLFQLFCVVGEWDRALSQLAIVGEMDKLALPMVQMYREAIRCEALRTEIFAGERSPIIFGEPPTWIGLLVQALPLVAQGKASAAEDLRNQAFEQAPATAGRLNDAPFDWLADADPRLGPVLEAIINGRYYWMPLENVRRIDMEEPEDLRDCVWMPAHFEFANGGETVGLIPTRYPGSSAHDDPLVKLARKTLWEVRDGMELPVGQRMLVTDAGDQALMDARSIVLGDEASSPAAE